MAKALTTTAVKNVKPSPARREIPDPGCRGLRLIVQPSGARSWALRYRFAGRTRKLTLGSVLIETEEREPSAAPELDTPLSLAAARELATRALRQARSGTDPGQRKREAKRGAPSTRQNTVKSLSTEFLQREGSKLKSLGQRRYDLALICEALGHLDITEVKRTHIVRFLDQIEEERGPVMADRVLGVLGRLMTWHAGRSDDFRSVVVRGMRRSNPRARARSHVLSDDDLRAIWKTAELPGPFGAFVRFTLLTATRRNEAAGLRRRELVDAGTWIIPGSRYKTKLDHLVPLSTAAQAIIEAQPCIGTGDLVFTFNGENPIVGFGRLKTTLDKASGVAGWKIHDLRRTARTLMSRAGIPGDIAERCLGHAIGGMRGIYDRHGYAAEKRRAFDALAAQVERIVHPPPASVVPLREHNKR
jgi:integrase